MYLRSIVHKEARLQGGDAKGIEDVAQHIIGKSFSLAKLNSIDKSVPCLAYGGTLC
jgi:hypothetical protein